MVTRRTANRPDDARLTVPLVGAGPGPPYHCPTPVARPILRLHRARVPVEEAASKL